MGQQMLRLLHTALLAATISSQVAAQWKLLLLCVQVVLQQGHACAQLLRPVDMAARDVLIVLSYHES